MSMLRPRLLSVLLFVACAQPAAAQSHEGRPWVQLYTLDRTTNDLCTINLLTGQIDSRLALSHKGLWTVAYNWQHDKFYGLYALDPANPFSGQIGLASVNRHNGHVTAIGTLWARSAIGGAINPTGVACDPKSGGLFLISDEWLAGAAIGRLCHVNATTAEVTQIGEPWTGGDHANGIPWPWLITADYSGNIWATNPSDGDFLWEIDEATATYGDPRQFKWNPAIYANLSDPAHLVEHFGGIAFEPGDPKLYALGDRFDGSGDSTASLYVIDGRTGVLTHVGDLAAFTKAYAPFRFLGLAFAPHGGKGRD
jgi:hypothetical protein